jgi:uncharacterized protein YndB with AHSA1/START domain
MGVVENRVDSASATIAAPADEVYRAFVDPHVLMAWLPPGDMTGHVLEYDFREGGRYRIELHYSANGPDDLGKTTGRTDISKGRFLALEPARRIVQSVEFESEKSDFSGEMIMTWSFEPLQNATRVTVTASNVPPGITRADHDAGLRSSLENLTRYCE